MANVTSLDIDVNASATTAVSSLENVTEELKLTASAVKSVATSLKNMGLDRVSKQFTQLAKDVSLEDNLKRTQKQIEQLATAADKAGREGPAAFLWENADPAAMEDQMEAAEAAEKAAAEQAKAQAKERAEYARQEAKERAAAIRRMQKEAAESERAYTRIVNEEARKRAAETAASARQAQREQTIGAQALARAQAAQARESARQAREAARAQAAAAKAAAAAARQAAKEQAAAAKAKARAEKEAQREAERAAAASAKQQRAAMKNLSELGKGFDAPFAKIKSFIKAIGRIALYRAIRTAIKNITAAIKEGRTNLEAYSREVGTAFAPALDNLRSHVLWLKNAFATALRPVIEALIPVIQRLVDWLVKAADYVAQVMSILTGKVDDNERYTKAVLTDIQDSKKEAKELRRTLLGFDEINRLDGDTGSGETNNAGLMFTQADVSDEAKATAEKISGVLAKIKEFIDNTDWGTVLKVIGAILALRAVIRIIAAVRKAWTILKSIGTVIGTIVGKLGVAGSIILALVAIFAIWGDKISKWLADVKKKVDNFFDGLKKDGKNEWNAVVKLVKDIVGTVIETVGLIASIVYKLFHGDFKGAFDDLIRLLGVLVKGIIDIVGGIINIILGWVSDMVNDIVKGALWIYNNGIVPVINWVATAIANVKIFFHNFGVDLKIGFWTVVKAIIDVINWALSKVEGAINAAIDLYNSITGSQIKPISLQIDSTNVDQKIEELKNTKLDPITETIQFVSKVEQPSPIDLKLNLAPAKKGVDDLVNRIIGAENRVASITAALRTTGGGGGGRATYTTYASGGFPAVGTVFIAGERGAEYVADINGRTGVYNTDQMSSALYRAMVAALATMPNQGGGDIYLDGEKIYTSVVRRNNNQVRSTGRTALLT